MSCPFRRSSSHVIGAAGSGGGGGPPAAQLKRTLTHRQSSVHIAGPDDIDSEDRNTLNLKNLSTAILLLTSPPVSQQKK